MNPTPYPDINSVLGALLTSVQAILGERFAGMYLYGSLALGDFEPHRSDIDVLVVTGEELNEDDVRILRGMHERIAVEYPRWGPELEGSYIPSHALRRYDPSDVMYPHIERHGLLVMECQDAAFVVMVHTLREHGITLAGPPPNTLIDPVSTEELRQATVDIVLEWWEPMLNEPSRLRDSGYQVYAVLTMCRVLYTLQHGAIVSKPTAGRWAMQSEAKPWSKLIEWGLEWNGMAQEVGVEEAVGLIGYVVGRCREWEPRKEYTGNSRLNSQT